MISSLMIDEKTLNVIAAHGRSEGRCLSLQESLFKIKGIPELSSETISKVMDFLRILVAVAHLCHLSPSNIVYVCREQMRRLNDVAKMSEIVREAAHRIHAPLDRRLLTAAETFDMNDAKEQKSRLVAFLRSISAQTNVEHLTSSIHNIHI